MLILCFDIVDGNVSNIPITFVHLEWKDDTARGESHFLLVM